MSLNKGKLIRCFHHNLFDTWAVVVVKWSAYLPSIQTIRVRIPLTPTVFSVKFVFEKNKNEQKEAGVGPFLKNLIDTHLTVPYILTMLDQMFKHPSCLIFRHSM